MSERAWWIVAGVLVVAVLLAGGAFVGNRQSRVHALKGQVRELRSELKASQEDAAGATTRAREDAAAALKSQQDAVNVRDAEVSAREQAVTAKEAGAKATKFDDGYFEVGRDIQPGKYHRDAGDECYYANLGTNPDDIKNNNITTGPATVLVTGPYFESKGCGTWTKVG